MRRTAIARWVVQHDVFLFYGNGGLFRGELVERWYAALQAAEGMRLYVGGAGSDFSIDPLVRARGTQWFKTSKVPFAVVTENPMHRVLGATGRLLGMDLHIYSWSESDRPFQKLGVSRTLIDELDRSLHGLRRTIEDELAQQAR